MSALAISEIDHTHLRGHLFPQDGGEAAAILVCGMAGPALDRLCVRTIITVPYSECIERTRTRLTWPGFYLDSAIDQADEIGGTIILAHSHPGGYYEFSGLDDASDSEVIPCIQSGVSDTDARHGSAIMIPDGNMKIRLYDRDLQVTMIENITAVGQDIRSLSKANDALPVAFSTGMTRHLKRMTACIVGVSGTGSIVAEILARLGVGRIILIDFDRVEAKNLNRILSATPRDIGRYKTHVVRDAILTHHPDTDIVTVERLISHTDAIISASEADVLFSCVDSVEGRYYCDIMTQAFICPMVDIGVTIPTRRNANGDAAIADVCGRIDYIYPGGTTLWGRGVITGDKLSAEYIRKVDPDAYAQQLQEGYLKGISEEAPSVISLNMRAASAGVNEWLARLYKIRHDTNDKYARCFFSLASCEEEYEAEPIVVGHDRSSVYGAGLKRPLLGILAERNEEMRIA